MRREAVVALEAAKEAAAVVMGVYAAPFDVEFKVADDPVTRADKESNALLCVRLAAAFPGVPVVAEESDPATYAGFASAEAAWFVDPLDGTRDFVARNGEFAVMIGLAEAGRSVLGVLVLPAFGRSFVGAEGVGAFEVAASGARTPIRVATRTELEGARVLVSRSRRVPEAEAKIAELGLVAVPCGSAGVKGAKIACGEADLYVQAGNAGLRWDSCAPEAIVRAAGGSWVTAFGDPYDYGQERIVNDRGVVAGNDALVARLIASFKW